MRLALLLLIGLVGCAHDVHVKFPAPRDAPTGTLVLLLSKPATGVTVAVNGTLVVEDKHTARIVISGIPSGTAELVITANGADKQFRTWVDGERVTTMPLGVPDASASFLKSIVGTLISIAAYSLLL